MNYQLLHNKQHWIRGDSKRGAREFLLTRIGKNCMYCGATSGKFVEEHVLPEGLGNNTYFTKNAECGVCNGVISVHEDSLVKMLAVDRVLARGDMKKGKFPKFKYKIDSKSYLKAFQENKKIHIGVDINFDDIYVGITSNNKLHIAIKHQKLSLGGICKALTHMAWPLLKDEHSKLPYIPDWILNKITLPSLRIDILHIYGKGLSVVALEVWENIDKSSNYPYLIRYFYGFTMIQFYLPASQVITEDPEGFGDGLDVPNLAEEGYSLFDDENAMIKRNSHWLLNYKGITEEGDGSITIKDPDVISIGGVNYVTT